jgi:hypothetical protein
MKHRSLSAATRANGCRRHIVFRRGFQRHLRIKPTIRYFQITASSLQLHHHPKAGQDRRPIHPCKARLRPQQGCLCRIPFFLTLFLQSRQLGFCCLMDFHTYRFAEQISKGI